MPRATIPIPNAGGDFPGTRVPTQAPLDAFGGGEATDRAFGASAGLSAEVGAVYQKHLEDAIQTQEVDNLSQLSAEETRLKTQLSQVKGKDALQAAQQATSDFDKFHSDLAANTANPVVQRATQAHAARFRDSLNSWASGYANQEFRRYDEGSVTSAIQNERDAAIADGSPQRIGMALERQRALLSDYGKRAGWSPEETQLNTAKATSSTHLGVLEMIAAGGNDLAARNYYDANKEGFVGNDRIHAEKMLENTSYRGEAQRAVLDIFKPKQEVTKTGDMAWRVDETQPTEAETFAAVDKISDPKLQDMVRERVRGKWADIKRADAEDYSKALQDAGQTIMQTGNIDSIPPSVASQLKYGDAQKLKKLADSVRNGFPSESDPEKWLELTQQASKDPAAFAKRPILLDKSHLSETDWKHFGELQAKVAKDDPKTASMLNFQQRVEDTLLANNVFSDVPNKLQGDERKRYAQFSLSADARIRQFEQTELGGKRSASPVEQQKIIDQMIQERTDQSKGMLFWKEPLVGGEVLLSDIKVPETQKSQYTQLLKSYGKAASEEKIKRLYRAALAGDRGQFDRIAAED